MTSPNLGACFGQAVKQLREQKNWSQERLAAESDLNRTYVGEIERGRVVPSLVTLQKLAHALGLASSALVAHSEQLQHKPVGHTAPLMAIAG
ncbi:helix-turn-helix domain-containing protein [Variovorax sp. HJSM1_2]|uniref:helix-turn-helix domain-containing protein n=1 Tax=Variovorax sp. HJSM1_2 TaxID=3366263 RepID=UPI003BCAEDDB